MLSCSVRVPRPVACVVRQREGKPETLVFSTGTDGRSRACLPLESGITFAFGPPLTLWASRRNRPYCNSGSSFGGATYSSSSDTVIFMDGHALVQLDKENIVSVVAGSRSEAGSDDGLADEARFQNGQVMCCGDGHDIYVADGTCIRMVTLLDSDDLRAVVSTIYDMEEHVCGLAFEPSSQGLLVCTATAVYRLEFNLNEDEYEYDRVAGVEGERGNQNGEALDARFNQLTGIALSSDGSAYLTDMCPTGLSVRKLASDGTVTTVATFPAISSMLGPALLDSPTILPGGCLLLLCTFADQINIISLGLKPAVAAVTQIGEPEPAAQPPQPAALHPLAQLALVDYGALLESEQAPWQQGLRESKQGLQGRVPVPVQAHEAQGVEGERQIDPPEHADGQQAHALGMGWGFTSTGFARAARDQELPLKRAVAHFAEQERRQQGGERGCAAGQPPTEQHAQDTAWARDQQQKQQQQGPAPGPPGPSVPAQGLQAPGPCGAAGLGAGGSSHGRSSSSCTAPDVTVVVGGRAFPAHRLILAARCPYFRSRLDSTGFADSGCRQIELPEADPDAFAALLRHLYTGATSFPPAALRPAAELADRLLLPALCSELQRQVLAAAAPASACEDLLWAEARGFGALREGLLGWLAAHEGELLGEGGARRGLKRLAAEGPDLLLELMDRAAAKRARREG